ncbi:MAG: lytic murein transglycosylase [Bauldia sp.]|nr:lytic murein transglycosylase [Bauldia sp.]
MVPSPSASARNTHLNPPLVGGSKAEGFRGGGTAAPLPKLASRPSTSPRGGGSIAFSRAVAAIAAVIVTLVSATAALADAASDRWVQAFWPRAEAAGISWSTYSAALGNFEPDPSILERASNQAEFVRPIWDYLDSAVSDERIANGRAAMAEWAQTLARIEATYGVDRHILVAIWGIESSYGAVLSNPQIVRSTIRSLATLAYQGGSRQNFGQTQLIAALKILQRGDITLAGMTGSWAGAMGHTQFIPTTFEAYAVDFNGDGRRDIWSSPVDALASAANYLRAMGWESGKTWGYEVVLPAGFNYSLAEGDGRRPLSEWASMGIRRANGQDFPRPGDAGDLWIPAGANGPAFLLLHNFRVIKRYNNADSYALAVGHLADRLRDSGPFRVAWPRNALPLNQAQRFELQQLLASLGHYAGPIDAIVGGGTRAAIRDYQRTAGMTPDGYASDVLLQQLRRE